MSDWLRKVHIYLQGFYKAATSWRRIRLAEDLGPCYQCKENVKPLDSYMHDWGDDPEIWHARCARWRLYTTRELDGSLGLAT